MTLDIDEALQWATRRTPAVLITIKADGSPQSSDVAFAVIDGQIVISITDDRAKTANIGCDPRGRPRLHRHPGTAKEVRHG